MYVPLYMYIVLGTWGNDTVHLSVSSITILNLAVNSDATSFV